MVFNVASPFNYLPSFSILFSREGREEGRSVKENYLRAFGAIKTSKFLPIFLT